MSNIFFGFLIVYTILCQSLLINSSFTLTLQNAKQRLALWKHVSSIQVSTSIPSDSSTDSINYVNLHVEQSNAAIKSNGYCQLSTYLTPLFGTKTRSSNFCKTGNVILNGKKAYGTTNVYPLDNITVYFPQVNSNISNDTDEKEMNRLSRLLNFTQYLYNTKIHNPPVQILYEDNYVAVLYKPAGVHSLAWIGTNKKNIFSFSDCLPLLLTPPISTTKTNLLLLKETTHDLTKPDPDSLQLQNSTNFNDSSHHDKTKTTTHDGLNNNNIQMSDLAQDALEQPLPCHRLDARVSGCLVVAKTKHAMSHICQQFKSRIVKKEYHAVLCGFPSLLFSQGM